jgi:hypothetical protein
VSLRKKPGFVVAPPAVLAERDQRMQAAAAQDACAALLGDPLPGRSALDERRQREAAIAAVVAMRPVISAQDSRHVYGGDNSGRLREARARLALARHSVCRFYKPRKP